MLKKTLLTAAAALALTAGATTFATPDAKAGVSFNIGFYGHGFHGYGHVRHYGYGHRTCYVKYYKKIKVKVWTHHGPVWKWIKKPVYACHYGW